jgi:exopolysaccharide biosynthesis polyprenyl glycosylphosphotransferase
MLCMDALAVGIAGVLSQHVGAQPADQRYGASMIAVFTLATITLLACSRAYAPRIATAIADDIAVCLGVTAVATMIVTLGQSLFLTEISGTNAPVRLWVFAATYLAFGRAALILAQRSMRRAGAGVERTLIVGAGQVGRLVAKRLAERPELGLKPIGFLDKDPLEYPRSFGDEAPSVVGASWDLERVVQRERVEHVVLAFSSAPHSVLLDLVRRCEDLGLRVSVVPRLFERMSASVTVTHVGGLPLLELRPADPHGVQYAVKYAIDRVVAAVVILLLAPILLALALSVLLSLGRPIFFRQRRVGLDGRPFEMLKFRTMRPDPEDAGEADAGWLREQLGGSELPETGESDEDRCTSVGRWMRRTSIDELPQLLNVLRGDMSFVGPRPERVRYVEEFDEGIYRYSERHRVKGGLTGWAQIHGLRGKSSLADRVEWDNFYIENFSLWLDLKIVIRTIPEMFRGRAA